MRNQGLQGGLVQNATVLLLIPRAGWLTGPGDGTPGICNLGSVEHTPQHDYTVAIEEI